MPRNAAGGLPCAAPTADRPAGGPATGRPLHGDRAPATDHTRSSARPPNAAATMQCTTLAAQQQAVPRSAAAFRQCRVSEHGLWRRAGPPASAASRGCPRQHPLQPVCGAPGAARPSEIGRQGSGRRRGGPMCQPAARPTAASTAAAPPTRASPATSIALSRPRSACCAAARCCGCAPRSSSRRAASWTTRRARRRARRQRPTGCARRRSL